MNKPNPEESLPLVGPRGFRIYANVLDDSPWIYPGLGGEHVHKDTRLLRLRVDGLLRIGEPPMAEYKGRTYYLGLSTAVPGTYGHDCLVLAYPKRAAAMAEWENHEICRYSHCSGWRSPDGYYAFSEDDYFFAREDEQVLHNCKSLAITDDAARWKRPDA